MTPSNEPSAQRPQNGAREPSPEPYYRPLGSEETTFRLAYEARLPLLLKGPTGCGKSRFVEAMAAKVGRDLVTVACNDETSAADLLGRWIVRGGDTEWQDGPVTRAVRAGAILYLDEVAEAREDVVVVLHPLSDHRRQLFVDRRDEVLSAPPEFMLLASYNPGYRRGLRELKPSTRQRFLTLRFDYPPADAEREIVRREANVEAGVAKNLVLLAAKIRKLEELSLSETVSTRQLVNAAKLIRAGLPPRTACAVAIVGPLTEDVDAARALQDLADLSF